VKRFLFLNDAQQLLAFSIHPTGTNLPDLPHAPWRPVDDHGYLGVIYDWEPDKLKAMADELRETGFFVFSRRRTVRSNRGPAPSHVDAIEDRTTSPP
jgi:hypothetical protein